MSRYTPRHAQTAGDLSFAVQFNDETLWPFTDRGRGRDGFTDRGGIDHE